MAGPIDCRISPDRGQRAGHQQADRVVRAQPDRHRAAAATPARGRRVYPGFVQLAAFMSMNRERHIDAFRDYYHGLVDGDHEKASEPIAPLLRGVLRGRRPAGRVLPGDGASWCSRSYALPRGELRWRGRTIDPRRSAARRCSPSKASATTSARSARRWPRRTCASSCGPTCARTRAGRRRPLRRVQRRAGSSTSTRCCAT